MLSYKELGLWSVVTLWQSLCILCQKAFQVQIKSCYTTTETDWNDGSSHMTWMQHLSGDLFGFFSRRNNGDGFCMIHLVITFTDCWFLFPCDGATRVFVCFTSWYALVLHTLSQLRSLMSRLHIRRCSVADMSWSCCVCTHRVVAVMTSDGVFFSFYSSFG